MKINGLIIFAVLLFMLPMIESCRTELCYNHYPSAGITLDWEREWERDYGSGHVSTWDATEMGLEYSQLRPGVPEWVNLVKYGISDVPGQDFLQSSGGDIVLDEGGGQSFLFYNGDTEYIVLHDIASLSQIRATPTSRTRASISYIMARHPGLSTTNPPDVLYSAFVDNIPKVKFHEKLPMPVKMQPLVFTYVIRYEFEYGMQYVQQARGALGGMAESVYLRDGRTSDEATIILFECDVKDYGCEACVKSFGVPGFPDEYYGRAPGETAARPYTLNLEILLRNGKVIEFNYDIAEQMEKQPKGGVIKISGIRIEDEQNASQSTGDFNVDLSDWGHVDIDLPVGADQSKK